MFPQEIQEGLKSAGISTSSLDRIRLTRGVVGKASYVAGAAVLALGTVAIFLRDPLYLILDGVLIVLVFISYFGGSLWFANRHPGVALLEGAELIQWRQMDMAARDVTDLQKLRDAAPQLIGKSQGD